jgi:hypothetical protein
MEWRQPSQPPGISHTLTTCDQRPVHPTVYQVPSSSISTFSSPCAATVCSMYGQAPSPMMSMYS